MKGGGEETQDHLNWWKTTWQNSTLLHDKNNKLEIEVNFLSIIKTIHKKHTANITVNDKSEIVLVLIKLICK